jgi:hypothetical protein
MVGKSRRGVQKASGCACNESQFSGSSASTGGQGLVVSEEDTQRICEKVIKHSGPDLAVVVRADRLDFIAISRILDNGNVDRAVGSIFIGTIVCKSKCLRSLHGYVGNAVECARLGFILPVNPVRAVGIVPGHQRPI